MKKIIFLIIYFLFIPCDNEEILANKSMNALITPRIIGGADADMELHSYTLTLRNRGNFLCTAFAVSRGDVFTAAHCFKPTKYLFPPYSDVTIHSGVNSAREIGIIHAVERVTVHPKYDKEWKKSSLHDIAHVLLREESKLNLDENQLVLDLPTHDIESGTLGTMTGWGCTRKNTMVPAKRLQMLQMRMLDYLQCQPFIEHRTLYKEQLCAFHSEGHGCAYGDSGGPLVINNVAIGIHSWCPKNQCGAGYAEVLTNVFQERLFIKSVMPEAYPTETLPVISSTTSSSPEPDNKGKKPKRESSNRSVSSWFRKITCTAK